MSTVEFAKTAITMSTQWMMGMFEDMKDEPMLAPVPGGNHTMWCVGHLAYSEGNLINGFVGGEENPLAQWSGIFGQGTTPSDDTSVYPPYEEVLGKMKEIRESTMALLETMTDEDLASPSHASEELAGFFGTKGQCFAALPMHFTFHGGQVADARRAAGRTPLMG